MTLTFDFEGQIFNKKLYYKNNKVDWHGIKRIWLDRILNPCCDFKFDLIHDIDL